MSLPKFEIPTDMRDFAEKSFEQARKAFDGFLGAASKAVESAQGQANTVQGHAADFTRKAISQAGTNLNAAFAHAQRLARAKDPQEAMQLQAEFLKEQFAQIQAQMKELGAAMQSNMKDFAAGAQQAAQDAGDEAKRK